MKTKAYKCFFIQGMKVEVRFENSMDGGSDIVLDVLSIVQHPFYAETECFIEPCGPTRYNAKNDIAVIHVDITPLRDMDTITPACLPEIDQSYLLQFVTHVGHGLKVPRQPSIGPDLLENDYTWNK